MAIGDEKKSVVSVLDVGQGDCILITPPEGCKYSSQRFFVDLGTGVRDISECVSIDEPINLILTHHHKDHIGGLKHLADTFDRVKTIYMPLYHNQITLIAEAILNLKGIKKAKNCDDLIEDLQRIIDDEAYISDLLDRSPKTKLRFAYEGMRVCDHIEFLNPPKCAVDRDARFLFSSDEVRKQSKELFEEDFANVFIFYLDMNSTILPSEGEKPFQQFWKEDQIEMSKEMGFDGMVFVSQFITENESSLRFFNQQSSRRNLLPIHEKLKELCHEMSIVMKITYNGQSMLLAGDASREALERVMKNGKTIHSDYLKMPHHGSKENMTEEILDAIHPKVAIISHNNRRFGKTVDSHPHQEVIDMLNDRDIRILITNSVIKTDKEKHEIVILEKEEHCTDEKGFVELI